ncbi:MAG TPA: leucine-rich repeat domain-containing protein [Phycisphaerae bacterium]|nr:leucine-rich repeat domain-containing protein [Phycisphaerae bacterium]
MIRSSHAVLLVVALVAAALCVPCGGASRDGWRPPQVVRIEGDEERWIVMSPLYGLLFAGAKKGEATHLLVRDGELIQGVQNPLFPYRSADGRSLKVTGDKVHVTLAGKTVTLSLDEEGGWDWLKKATPEQMASLRFVMVGAKEPPEGVDAEALLKRLAGENPAVGLIVSGADALAVVLRLFDPHWFGFGGATLEKGHSAALVAKKQLRTLFTDADEKDKLAFLAGLSNLETLFLTNWDAEKAGPLPDGLANLRSLVVFGGKMEDLSCLGKQPGLEELTLMAVKSLTDISALANHPHLKTLCLRSCEGVTDLAVLEKLKGLKWLALPPATTQKQFAEIVRSHPDLVVLEATKCKKITDLGPAGDLVHLKALIVATEAPPDPLYQMKGLEFLAVAMGEEDGKVKPDDQEMVVRLRKELPDTAVVLLAPMCLGSGWILVLVPAVAMAWWLTKRRATANRRAA